jgi:methionine-R-sulfoxide reductase
MLQWKDVIRFAQKGNPEPDKRIEKTEQEWQQQLTPEQYMIARQKGTERAFTGAYCEAHDPGLYGCICCGSLLFDSATKFESKSGWPSFTQPCKVNSIKYEIDDSYGMRRVEVMCNVCDCHLGHVFPDGPEPGGLRYCINSASVQKLERKV